MAEIPEDQLVNLIIRSITDTLNESDRRELMDWAHTTPARERLLRELHDPKTASKEMSIYARIDPCEGYGRWLLQRRRKKQFIIYLRTLAAAVVVGTLVLWWILKSNVLREASPPPAVDTLAMVERSIENSQPLSTNGLNSADTLKVLPDGTRVWLNRESTVFYPAKFSGKERLVQLNGEGYFEVAHDTQHPFIVKVNGGVRVEALGTSFDVMAYPGDDSIQATLIEGKVRVVKNGDTVRLKAGQQVSAGTDAGGLSAPLKVDVSDFAGWKRNLIYIPDHSSLDAMLKRIARWYHLQLVVNVTHLPDRLEYGGSFQRNLPLAKVLEYMKPKGIKYTVTDRQLIVDPDRP